MLVFDIETDGLLDTVTKVHCINILDRETGEIERYHDDTSILPRRGSLDEGLVRLANAREIAGQNIIKYDLPVLRKVYPGVPFRPGQNVIDTKVCSAVIWTDLADHDFAALRKGKLPPEFQKQGLVGSHSLKAWGYRLGDYKGDFDPKDYGHTWATVPFSQDMSDYGAQDCVVTLKLLERIEAKGYSQECLDLEHRVAAIIFRQQQRGFAFDVQAAEALTAKLQRRLAELEVELQAVFPPWQKSTGIFIPKRDDKKRGYKKGEPIERFKEAVFNPASRDNIADRLIALRGWKPAAFTDGGKPQVDETILSALPWPEAKLLAEYLMVEKRLGQVAAGKEAWLKHAVKDALGVHRIHGDVNTNGAVTGRMTHMKPNVAQTPACGAPYGEECRSLYVASPGLVLVGCDAEGLELRCLAHYMARYDGGAYVETVVNGKKEDGTDVHSVNMRAAGLNIRDSAKTFCYALIYGAGDFKLGTIVYDDFTDSQKGRFLCKYKTLTDRKRALTNLGKARRARLMDGLPALGKLVEDVKAAVKARGHLRGLDGRLLHVRGEHSALNTLLQSAGALVMKKAIVLWNDNVAAPIRSLGGVVELVGTIHDEIQVETEEQYATEVGQGAADCIRRAGEAFKFRCPLAGSFSSGRTWAETH